MVIPRTSEKNNNAQINDRVSRAMAGRPLLIVIFFNYEAEVIS